MNRPPWGQVATRRGFRKGGASLDKGSGRAANKPMPPDVDRGRGVKSAPPAARGLTETAIWGEGLAWRNDTK